MDTRACRHRRFRQACGANAVVVSRDILARVDSLKGRLIPNDIDVEVTRDYGATANEKAKELLFHLALATARSFCSSPSPSAGARLW